MVCTGQLTYADFQAAKQVIDAALTEDRRNRIPGFVRLIFHDCVGDACDGCVDLNNEENNGLAVHTQLLDGLYSANSFASRGLSRADFYALASIQALVMATAGRDDTFDPASFKIGRRDCSASPGEDDQNELFPGADLNYQQNIDFFATHFGMTAQETIAILGAHTLGRARQDNSGFERPWVQNRGTEVLDNAYYREMLDRPWVRVSAPNLKTQWQRPNTARNTPGNENSNMFIDADVGLAVDFSNQQCRMCPPNDQNQNNCCPQSAGFQNTLRYRNDNAEWVRDFSVAFYKMIDKVQTGVTLVNAPTEDISTTTAPTTPSTSTGSVHLAY